MKKYFYILILIFLSQCGYSALYDNKKSNDISITIIQMQGDKKMNNLIKSQLTNYINKDKDKDKNYEIEINTKYNKSIISKDKKGVATEYKLITNANFKIYFEEREFNFSIEEKLNTKNSSNSFELKKYEQIIKNNFAESIKEKLIFKLLTIK